eukprot:TRINITY_DN4902_c0_g1_i2.p2 TRINITY_DN4902_c0_g1~~TRINITY_DN4902_c0_g1_i2.p2  ORF type:complete len:134 (-),score=28.76 TRINITY_DN4902_c0_g1_i2:228-629(-)
MTSAFEEQVNKQNKWTLKFLTDYFDKQHEAEEKVRETARQAELAAAIADGARERDGSVYSGASSQHSRSGMSHRSRMSRSSGALSLAGNVGVYGEKLSAGGSPQSLRRSHSHSGHGSQKSGSRRSLPSLEGSW